MTEQRYMKNKVTKKVFPYDPAVMRVSAHVVECTKEGVIIGRAPVAENTMLEKISELQSKYEAEVLRSAKFETAANNALTEVENLKLEIETQKTRILELKDKIASLERGKTPITDQLNAMKLDDLRKMAGELGIKNYSDFKKEDLIVAIIAAKGEE